MSWTITRYATIGIRDSAGALQASIRYAAYGDHWTDNQALVDKLAMTYNGRDGVVSLGSGLYWMRHRSYSSAQGRFVAADPVESVAGSTQAGYNYADGDPVNNVDPTGQRITGGCHNSLLYFRYSQPLGRFYGAISFYNWGTARSCSVQLCILRGATSAGLAECGTWSSMGVATVGSLSRCLTNGYYRMISYAIANGVSLNPIVWGGKFCT